MASLERSTSDYRPRYSRFLLQTKNYVVQYNHVYLTRLAQIRPTLRLRAQTFWKAETGNPSAALPLFEKVIDSESLNGDDEDEASS